MNQHTIDYIKRKKRARFWRKVWKGFVWTMVILTFLFLMAKLTKYEEREEYINRYTCAVWGYYEDCKTPRSEEDRLK